MMQCGNSAIFLTNGTHWEIVDGNIQCALCSEIATRLIDGHPLCEPHANWYAKFPDWIELMVVVKEANTP